MACVLLDVDGTLLDAPSGEARFVRYLLRNRMLGPGQIARTTWFGIRWFARFGGDVMRKNKAYLAGLDTAAVGAAAEAFVADELVPRLRPEMLQRIEHHRAHGDTVVLLTGTPEFIAKPLARRLGIDTWEATHCAHRCGRYVCAPPTQHPLGESKLPLARALCERMGTLLEASTAYADSNHDIPLLEAVGRAVTVTPDHKLGKAARERGWEIFEPSSLLATPRIKRAPY